MTFFETAGQAPLFLLLAHAGIGAALLYDIFGIFRRRAPGFFTVISDIVWCLLSGVLCILALALGGEDGFRGYALLGMSCGAGLYVLGLRRVIRWGWRKMKKRNAGLAPPQDLKEPQ